MMPHNGIMRTTVRIADHLLIEAKRLAATRRTSLAKVVEDPGSGLPDLARDICRMVLEQIELLTSRLTAVSAKLAAASRAAAMPRQLQTMPGVGPITALAVETFAPPMDQPTPVN